MPQLPVPYCTRCQRHHTFDEPHQLIRGWLARRRNRKTAR